MNYLHKLSKHSARTDMFKIPAPAGAAAMIMDSFKGRPGLYLHIPFCESFCPFCPYNKTLYDKQLAASYFTALEQEINYYLEHTNDPFSSLYIGGGTPTLCLDELEPIMQKLSVTGERAIEMLPGHATEANIAQLKSMGINYLSLGVQSFNRAVLDYLKRPNTVTENHQAVAAAIGQFDCVDVDLIFDVAFEDESIFLRDLETCFQAGVEQISTYPLMRFGYTPFGKSQHHPGKEHQVLAKAEVLAQQNGYERRSVWTFNRRNAPNYTSITREFYLGCGAGAGSYTGSLFFLNHFSVSAYADAIGGGSLPIARATPLSQTRSAAYYLFWQAYTGKINVSHFDRLFPKQRMLRRLLRAFIRSGLLRACGDDLVLTQRGYDQYHDLERWVTYHFIEPLWADMMHEHTYFSAHMQPLNISQRFWLRLAGMRGSQSDRCMGDSQHP